MQNQNQIPEDIYYLVHITKEPKEKYDKWTHLHQGLFSFNKFQQFQQFPGVYFSLITKDNIFTEELYFGKNCLIFSRNLLKQKNYHINISDNNGFITETNTYFPCNIEEAIKKIKENSQITKTDDTPFSEHIEYYSNEVVFHDPISMELCCLDYVKYSKKFHLNNSIKLTNNNYLPNYQIENEITPNMDLLPFYCYAPSDEVNSITSSLSFFQNMAKKANISINLQEEEQENRELTKEELIIKIQEKSYFLYFNREKQNML